MRTLQSTILFAIRPGCIAPVTAHSSDPSTGSYSTAYVSLGGNPDKKTHRDEAHLTHNGAGTQAIPDRHVSPPITILITKTTTTGTKTRRHPYSPRNRLGCCLGEVPGRCTVWTCFVFDRRAGNRDVSGFAWFSPRHG